MGRTALNRTYSEMIPETFGSLLHLVEPEPEIGFGNPEWFCVVTNPRCEVRAQLDLEAAGYRTFNPMVKRWVTHARVKKAVERPLLARYLFVEVDYPRQSFGAVRLANGVESLLCNNGIPMVVPRRFVESFIGRFLAGEWNEIEKEDLPVGARVRIMDGRYEEMLATITKVKGHKIVAKLLESAIYTNLMALSVRAA